MFLQWCTTVFIKSNTSRVPGLMVKSRLLFSQLGLIQELHFALLKFYGILTCNIVINLVLVTWWDKSHLQGLSFNMFSFFCTRKWPLSCTPYWLSLWECTLVCNHCTDHYLNVGLVSGGKLAYLSTKHGLYHVLAAYQSCHYFCGFQLNLPSILAKMVNIAH